MVVDGRTAFTGGVNLADEYVNRIERFGHWKDTGVMLRGDAVRSFTLMFLQMWQVTEPALEFRRYLEAPMERQPDAKGYVLPYGDSPFDNERVGESVYLDIINRASRYVYIMTPYLIIDGEMTTALTFAAKRGVDVRIILPHIPDKKVAFALAYTHYRELIRAGVSIYEYTPGFVHAKVFLSDDSKAVVGSNLVKAAMFGADANWGRVLCAMGYSRAPFRPDRVDASFYSSAGRIQVCKDGSAVEFDEDLAKKILSEEEVSIIINVNEGDYTATCWGCDLTYDYVRINGDYRT